MDGNTISTRAARMCFEPSPRPKPDTAALLRRAHYVVGAIVGTSRRVGNCPRLMTRGSPLTWRWLCMPRGVPPVQIKTTQEIGVDER